MFFSKLVRQKFQILFNVSTPYSMELPKTEKFWLVGWLIPSLICVPRPDNNATEDDDDILHSTGRHWLYYSVLAVVLPGGYER